MIDNITRESAKYNLVVSQLAHLLKTAFALISSDASNGQARNAGKLTDRRDIAWYVFKRRWNMQTKKEKHLLVVIQLYLF